MNYLKKQTIIDYPSNELITSKRSKSQDSAKSSRCANICESITVDNYANEAITKTTNKNEKSAKKPRVIITCDSLLNSINERRQKKNCL